MNKIVLVIVLAALGVGGWYGLPQYQGFQARQAQKAQVAAAQARQHADQAAYEAQQRKRQAEIDATRRDIETQLKPLRVTSIMLGQPAIVIIDKKEYAEGDPLSLPHGKQLQVTRVNEDGILLAYNGLSFRLDPPAAPDIEALRKK